MNAQAIGMRALLSQLGYQYDDASIQELAALLAGAQRHRHDVGSSQEETVTRSTALPVLNQINSAIGAGLRAADLDWQSYTKSVALDGPIVPQEVDDVVLHEQFQEALQLFRKTHPKRTEATAGNLAYAIIDMALKSSSGHFPDQLREAGANLGVLQERLARAIDSKPQADPERDPDDSSEQRSAGEFQRSVWLLQYKDEDRPAPLFSRDDPGTGIEWRSTKIVKDVQSGDPVIYWRNINKKTKDLGGIVGTGRFTSGPPRSEEVFDKARNKPVTWHYYPTQFVEIFAKDPLARDTVIKETGLTMNWGLGSILKIPPDKAVQLHEFLKSRGRIGIPEEPEVIEAPEIVFIGDAPKSDEDYLGRADLAFVLAARLNRAWDESNHGNRQHGEPASTSKLPDRILSLLKRARAIFRLDPLRPPYDNSFVVHIDAPWGGGKTTFSNYLSRILNPYSVPGPIPRWLAYLPIDDPRFWPEEFRRPWHVIKFNAWQHEHLDPPWWCLYQSVRQQCFRDVRKERFLATEYRPDAPTEQGDPPASLVLPDPTPKYQHQGPLERYSKWLFLWLRELLWRVFTPKVRILLLTFLITLVTAFILHQNELFDPGAVKNALNAGLNAGTKIPKTDTEAEASRVIVTALVIIFGGITGFWSIFAAFTESLLPGTPNAAKNYSLGSGDPLERFRRHFYEFTRVLDRPLLVVVDDIDRCEPQFVVELIRGIQTIFRSPRVTFLLLGDRDWVEHSFADVHVAMKGINVGPEHTFGGRFVEKAIQLSFVLPEITSQNRSSYVRHLLGVTSAADRTKPKVELTDEQRDSLETRVDGIMNNENPVHRDAEAETFKTTIGNDASLDPLVKEAVTKSVDRKLAFRSASDPRSHAATQHRLIPIASVLPANPRQIKRIINGIALFQEIARIQEKIQPGSQEWRKLALWVVIMTEWPRTWATLTNYPVLVDLVRNATGAGTKLGSEDPIPYGWVEEIRKNDAIMALLEIKTEDDTWAGAIIDARAIKKFRTFMPAASDDVLPTSSEAVDV